MKIRTGFVSNSSSASFIVTIDMKYKDFIDYLDEEFGFDHFDKREFMKKVEDDLEVENERLKNEKSEKPDKINEFRVTQLENTIKELEQLKDNINKFDKTDIIEAIFKYNRIRLTSINAQRQVALGTFTVMYNNADDMGRLMQSIITSVLLTHGSKYITVEVDDS